MSTESQVRSDVARLLKEGARLSLSLRKATDLPALLADWRRRYGEGAEEFVEGLPDFQMEYQSWYSEASLLVKIFLPDRLSDFRRLYEKPKEGLHNLRRSAS